MSEIESGDLKGIASTTIKKLRRVGLVTLESIAFTPPREITKLTGMGSKTAIKVNRLARKKIDPGFTPADQIFEQRNSLKRCRTGASVLNNILGGGVETGVITELIGEFGSGKTQICYTLSVLAPLPEEKRGLDGKVCVIDTEGTFLPERIKQIAENRNLDSNNALENVLIARAYNSSHQLNIIQKLPKIIRKNKAKRVIVDCMISHFRSEFIGRGSLADRQQKISSSLGNLLRIAGAFNVAVVLTNQVQAQPSVMFGDPNRPTGGHMMAHSCNHRIYLRKGRKNTRLVQVIDSPYLPEEKVRIAITKAGVTDSDGSFPI